MQEQDRMNTNSEIEAFRALRTKVDHSKKIHIELSDPSLESQNKDKFHKQMRTKLELLFKKIE
jgi:uncharacterized protein YaiL (DUF2058 family)